MFMLIAGLIPPLSPTSDAEQITQHLIENKLRIRWRVALMLVTSALVIPFNAVLTLRMRRAEGGQWGILSMTQILASAALYPAGFYVPFMMLAAAVFRPDHRSPELNLALDDLFWLMLIGLRQPRTPGVGARSRQFRRQGRSADISALVRLLPSPTSRPKGVVTTRSRQPVRHYRAGRRLRRSRLRGV
jgi:hypothetical protein